MKLLQKITITLFFLILAAFCLIQVKNVVLADKTPPVISFASDVIDVSVEDLKQDNSVLLSGVTARDNRDGDLTKEIFITGVTSLITNDTAKVSYAVFDSANNSVTASRTVHYTDYEKPVFSLSRQLIYSVGQQISLMDGRLTASDMIDGDLTDKIRVTSSNISPQYEGVYTLNVQVTNSLGDVSSLPLRIVVDNTGATKQLIVLRQYIVYIPVGGSFNPESYVVSVKNPDGTSAANSKYRILSNVDVNTPGNYDVAYTYDADGQSFTAYMAVVVK